MERKALSRITKISEQNLDRIAALKSSGYEPNDYIINQALDLLEKRDFRYKRVSKRRLDKITKISDKALKRISKLKLTGYESNDYIIGLALELLEKKESKKNGR